MELTLYLFRIQELLDMVKKSSLDMIEINPEKQEKQSSKKVDQILVFLFLNIWIKFL